jgi:DnaK suppressor protein
MPRRDALLRLATTLRRRRADQHKKLAAELANLRDFHASYSTGDSADEAFEAGSDEITSQLAELDARQLNQTERALTRLQHGTYGICEGGSPNCQKRIPLARLNALPYTTLCINCERDRERHPAWLGRRDPGSWGQVVDTQAPMQDQRINPAAFALSWSGNRRG